jgi:hypothetical protein
MTSVPTTSVCAIATLGPSSNGHAVKQAGTEGTYQFTVTFETPFASTPIVVATLLQDATLSAGDFADTFGMVVTSVMTTDFTVNVNRIDTLHGAWGQNLRIQYVAQ